MWQQKQNNLMDLDELEGLPGETTADKTVLWAKLESRLQKKPQRAKAIWYWAAAGLFLCAIVPFLLSDNKNRVDEPIVVNNISKSLEQTKRTIAIESIKLNATEIKLPQVVKNIPSSNNSSPVVKEKQYSFVSKSPLPIELIAQDYSPIDIDTVASSLAVIPKKKISVVHINELEEEDRMAEQNINIAKSLKKKRTKTADRYEYAGTLNFRIYFKN